MPKNEAAKIVQVVYPENHIISTGTDFLEYMSNSSWLKCRIDKLYNRLSAGTNTGLLLISSASNGRGATLNRRQ